MDHNNIDDVLKVWRHVPALPAFCEPLRRREGVAEMFSRRVRRIRSTTGGPRCTGRIGAALALAASLVALPCIAAGPAAEFTPNESLVSSQTDLIDPEYSQTRARVTWVDGVGNLWVAGVDRETGMLKPANGKGMLIDANAMSIHDLIIIGNGPEWISTEHTDQIVYTKFLPGQPHNRMTARLAIAVQDVDGRWRFRYMSDKVRNGPYASGDPGDPAPRVSYVDPFGNHYWSEIHDPENETMVPWYPPSYRSMRFVRGARAAVFVAPVDGISQVFRYWLDTQVLEQLTFDDGNKDLNSVPWMWQAPEFGDEFVLATIVDDRELRIYRLLDGAEPGPQPWSVIYRTNEPGYGVLSSPEPFTHNGKSYVFLSSAVPPNDFQSAIFLSNIDAAAPMFRQLTPDTELRARVDPEVFVTTSGAYIYFTRLDPALAKPWQNPGNCIACSEGVYRTYTGLGPVAPAQAHPRD